MIKLLKNLFPQKIKNLYHLAQAVLANFMYGFPSKSIKIIGVTGTDGKTTTVQMITKILEEAGHKMAMASTINYKIADKEWKNLSHFTTLSSFAVQKFILQAVKARCAYLVLETSSHSLDQFRVWGVPYQTAVITNVTREHLDYHKTMEKYRAAKQKLFRQAKTAVVNLDMERPEDFLQFNNEMKIVYTCHPERTLSEQSESKGKSKDLIQVDSSIASRGETSLGMTVIKAEDIHLDLKKTTFQVGNQSFVLYLPGDFNAENALAAISVGVSENIPLEICALALSKIENVPGRLEKVANNKGLEIIIDFALTPHALERLYKLLLHAKKPDSRIIAVFGSCGERDRGKRPLMGEIVARFADFVVVTNDEPYCEDPQQIIGEIVAGIKNKKADENLFVIPDRRAAIRQALQLAQAGDIVAVTGMGAEESMVVGTEKIPWNDRKVILEELQKL